MHSPSQSIPYRAVTEPQDFVNFPIGDVEHSISERFEALVKEHPNRIAIKTADNEISYDKLNRLSNQIARSIHSYLDSTTSVRIVIVLPKNISYLASLIAVLKAGHTYIPLDPAFPASRNEYIISDSQAALIITDNQNTAVSQELANGAIPIFNLGDVDESVSDENLDLSISPDALAYLIYTSGSTGNPKGVMQNHRNVLHGCMRRTNLQKVSPSDHMSLFYSCSVMGSVYCIFGALLNGASLHPYDIREDGLDALGDWLKQHKITIYHSVASVFRQFATDFEDTNNELSIRLVIFGGERVLVSDVELVRKAFSPSCEFFTGLGSTETGTVRHLIISPKMNFSGKVVPIGYPVEGIEVLLLDENRKPVPIGELGEITIKSQYIALGYWNKPEISQKVFRKDTEDPRYTYYHTGDMGVLNKDNLLEHKGRKDFQVKIRGFRVEVGEVETSIQDHPAIEEAVVVAREIDNETQLVAYLVQKDGSSIPTVRSLRRFLQSKLPYYMVPTVYVLLDSIPRTPNNKVDRNALPPANASNELPKEEIVQAQTPTEATLVEIFQEVLKLNDVGTNHNFFDLGGHSLSATQLISRIQNSLNAKISMRQIFEAEDLKTLAESIDATPNKAVSQAVNQIVKQDNSQNAPLSFAQRRMWIINRLYPQSAAYNISNTIRIKGKLHIEALEKSLADIIKRHDILRTVFRSDEADTPYQKVLPYQGFKLNTRSLTGLPEKEQEAEAIQHAKKAIETPHDLETGPLYNYELLELSDDTHILVLVFNHIIYDNIWSSGIFFRELNTLYGAYSTNSTPVLESLEFQFSDYASWQQSQAYGENKSEDIEYWSKQLANLPSPIEIPGDRQRPTKQSFQGGQVAFEIPSSLKAAISDLARKNSSTVFMIMLATWQILLKRYSQQDDILVGTPAGRRYLPETESMIGLFINTLVLRADLSNDPSFQEILKQTRTATLDAFNHDTIPFEDLVSELRLARDSGGTANVFQNLFIHRNAKNSSWTLPGLEIETIPLHPGGAKFDLTISILESDPTTSGTLEYSKDLFEEESAQRIADNYITLLSSIASSPDARISELNILSENSVEQIYNEWNLSTTEYPEELCTHQLFEQQTENNPDKIAIVFDDESISYSELNQRANQLAHHLRSEGIGPESLVAICMNRSINMIVGLLGILKAGGAYVPLDPGFPSDRLAYMIEDSDAPIFITETDVATRFPDLKAKKVLLDQPLPEQFLSQTQNLPVVSKPENLAYVIYTSGSTGKPKGVQLSNKGLVNFLDSMQKEPGLGPRDTLHAITTVSFDIAALEIFLPLITGAKIVLASKATSIDPKRIIKNLSTHKVTTMQATPATWRMLLDHGWDGTPKIKVLCGGEAMGTDLAERLLKADLEVWNLYGPTETTIWSSVAKIERPIDAAFIGHPIANTQLHIVDPALNLQPIGVPGELLIGGDGLARGYINRKELTAEKFIQSPFEKDKKLYRTGDLARRLSNGKIEFLGRMDNQVKLRGFRIELGEIETELSNHPAIKQAVVIAREDTPGDKRLVAYYTIGQNDAPESPQLKEHLRENLPEYMVPSAFVHLDEFPLTPNNKVDRKKLPRPAENIQPSSSPDTKLTQVEQRLIGLFEDILKIPVNNLETSFFDLGGHSLSALTLINAINRSFGTEIEPITFFENASISELKNFINSSRETSPDINNPIHSEPDNETKAKLHSILQAIESAPNTSEECNCPQMIESWIAQRFLAPLYNINRRSLRSVLQMLIAKLEGGSKHSTTLRKLFKHHFGITIGDFTSVRFDKHKLQQNTTIGRYCSIYHTAIFQNGEHPRNTLSTHGYFYEPALGFSPEYQLSRTQIEIGHDVWIGNGAKILYPTSKIGTGAIVAAGAVVIEDVPPYAIVAGYPAKIVRYRFSKYTIEKLLESKWWEHSLKELHKNRDKFLVPLEGHKIR